jgi:Cysteine-rich secretory protein family
VNVLQQVLASPRLLTRISVRFFLVCVWLAPLNVYAAGPSDSLGDTHTVFLPLVSKIEVAPASEPGCLLNEQEQQIATFLLSHPEQQRPTLACDPLLAAVARSRAADLGQRAYFSHVNPDGHGPNYLVMQAGYSLPTDYNHEATGNNIESIGAGANSATGMWEAWMVSPKHLTHILGTNDFFVQQHEYGIGYAQVQGSPYQYYWVVIIAKAGP